MGAVRLVRQAGRRHVAANQPCVLCAALEHVDMCLTCWPRASAANASSAMASFIRCIMVGLWWCYCCWVLIPVRVDGGAGVRGMRAGFFQKKGGGRAPSVTPPPADGIPKRTTSIKDQRLDEEERTQLDLTTARPPLHSTPLETQKVCDRHDSAALLPSKKGKKKMCLGGSCSGGSEHQRKKGTCLVGDNPVRRNSAIIRLGWSNHPLRIGNSNNHNKLESPHLA